MTPALAAQGADGPADDPPVTAVQRVRTAAATSACGFTYADTDTDTDDNTDTGT